LYISLTVADIEEETVRDHFKDCGEIQDIRLIRDKKTCLGKGFGYINFLVSTNFRKYS